MVRPPEEIIAGVDRVNVADVRRLAQSLLIKGKLNLAVIGPYQNEGDFEKLLKL